MPGIATGEVFSFAEGKLYLYASGSGTASGSGIGYAEDARLRVTWRWEDAPVGGVPGEKVRVVTDRRADLEVGALYADRTLFALANGTGAVNAKFEGLISAGAALQKSAQYVLYSGVVDECVLEQRDGALFRGRYAMHANRWSAFGQ